MSGIQVITTTRGQTTIEEGAVNRITGDERVTKRTKEIRKLPLGRRPATNLIYYATRSGRTTLDLGDSGGNPFASAVFLLWPQSVARQ